MIWQELTSTTIGGLDRSTPVVLPLTAIEQHGPHLPVSTDRLIGEHFARRLHEALPDKVLILPALAVGCSSHHMDFAGTLTLDHSTFIDAACQVLESAARHGFVNMVLLNSHGGNQAAGHVVLERFGAAHDHCRVVMATWWRLASEALTQISDSGPGGVGHACEFETSLIEVIAPELIDRQHLAQGQNVPTFAWAEGDMLRAAAAPMYRSMKQMTSSGVYGAPQVASRQKGEQIEAAVVAALTQIVTDLADEGS